MAEMTFDEYQALARRTQNPGLTPDYQMEHATWGLAAETGEILSLHQKMRQGHSLEVWRVAEEVGDLFWFAGELLDYYGLSMGDVAKANIEKLKARYPEGFSEERSRNRE